MKCSSELTKSININKHQLCATYHDLVKSYDLKHTTHALVLDFKKAFDKVPHELLMLKIKQIPDIDLQLVDWIQDFLTNRKQRVVLQGEQSSELKVTSGVPQGSVLGPTLFLIYINDLPSVINCDISLYADDTLLYQRVNNNDDAKVFQSNINAIHNWSVQWKMPFNESKCHVIAFGSQLFLPPYLLGREILRWANSTKYLGVIMQSDLKFEQHISKKSDQASRVLGSIKHTLHDAPRHGRLLAYTSLCRPILEYADSVWDPSQAKTIHSIEMIQNRAVRFICGIGGRHGVSNAKSELGLESLETRRRYHRVSLLLKVLQDEDKHLALSSSYEEIMNDRSRMTLTTRAAKRGEPTSVSSSSKLFFNSFLPRTIRDLRGD